MAEQSNTIEPTIVLKFGGSVLLDQRHLNLAVHEIYRWRRDGFRVVAVVSALQGETESLIQLDQALAPASSPTARAALVGLGELKSAALLGLLLDRAGVPARVHSPAALDLICQGDSLNADPIGINTKLIEQGLEQYGVVVVPGFVGIDSQGRTVTLGRGGSDSTAVFIAGKLSACRCRLIKDVDGLYEADPATHDHPDRYIPASYNDALRTDGSIIQHKSIRIAQSLGVEIELGRFNATAPTLIGDRETQKSPQTDQARRIRVAICGLGTVGGGLIEHLTTLGQSFEIAGASCRTPEKHTGIETLTNGITTDSHALAKGDADVLVELIGGIEPAKSIVETAIRHGKHVITANKALIAEHGQVLHRLAEEHGVRLLYSASVGGGLPVLERMRALDACSISGILNGTSQYVLSAIADGVPSAQAVEDAKRLGYAEADPSRDLDGQDALDKLRVIALQLGWSGFEIETPACDPSSIKPESPPHGQIAQISPLRASVQLEAVDAESPFAGLGTADNLVQIRNGDGSVVTVRGKGAGRWPTSESVLGDLLELSRDLGNHSDQDAPTDKEVAYA
ncbi:MAG: hypothetical protein ACF8MF_07355 [Phycisphaerales bacterium JB052]